MPKWFAESVVPKLGTRLRSAQVVEGGLVLAFTDEGALIARKGRFSGAKFSKVALPRGVLLNGSNCPHCGKPIKEPVGKVARLATEPAPAASQKPKPPRSKTKR